MISRSGVRTVGWAVIALVWSFAASAQTTDDIEWRDFDLLKGRLTMSAPSTAELEVLGPENIMAAPEPDSSVSQLRVEAAGTEIVVQVRELFALFPSDPETFFHNEIWGGEAPPEASKPGQIQVVEPLNAYGVATGSYRHPSGNNVLASLLVAQADGTAQYVYIMTWDVDSATLQRVSQIAERMVLSLRAGPRQGLMSGGSHTLATLPEDGGTSLALDLPAGYALSKEEGPDFVVYQIRKLSPLDAPSGELGLYVGQFPRYHHAQLGLPTDDLRKVPANILAANAQWFERRDAPTSSDPGWIHRELIVNLEPSPTGLKLHLFLSTPDASVDLAALTRIAEEGLRLTPP